MRIREKDIKLLWGKAASRCSICKTELTHKSSSNNSSFLLGEQAHIVGEKTDAPRGESLLTEEERNHYHNLILLCPNHHTEIDKNEKDWPIEKLHMVKINHELWVQSALSINPTKPLPPEEHIIANIIDATVEICKLDEWDNWTIPAYSNTPRWESLRIQEIFKYRKKVIATLWPATETEIAITTDLISLNLYTTIKDYSNHSTSRGLTHYPLKDPCSALNKNMTPEAKSAYYNWLESYRTNLTTTTKSINWFIETVRKKFNPMFFADTGVFILTTSDTDLATASAKAFVYSENEKIELSNTHSKLIM